MGERVSLEFVGDVCNNVLKATMLVLVMSLGLKMMPVCQRCLSGSMDGSNCQKQ